MMVLSNIVILYFSLVHLVQLSLTIFFASFIDFFTKRRKTRKSDNYMESSRENINFAIAILEKNNNLRVPQKVFCILGAPIVFYTCCFGREGLILGWEDTSMQKIVHANTMQFQSSCFSLYHQDFLQLMKLKDLFCVSVIGLSRNSQSVLYLFLSIGRKYFFLLRFLYRIKIHRAKIKERFVKMIKVSFIIVQSPH